jgi:3-oxoacyl-[acyl-carrier-protein] synthase II
MKRVVISGIGAVTPLGNNIEEYWNGLVNGQSGADMITHFDTEHFRTKFACEVKNFDIENYINRKEARKMDRFCHYAIASADEAMADSGLNEDASLNKERMGVIWASGIGGLETFQNEVKAYSTSETGIPKFNPFFIPKMIIDISAGHLSIRYGFKGPNFSVVSACASSTNAMIDALNYIRLGKADVVLTGGSEAAITEPGIAGFNAMKALSERNDDPQTASRPFDLDRNGFVMGEGGGALILEEYEHAKARGAKIYAEVIGDGATGDAHHITAPHPEGEGAMRVMKITLEDAGIAPEGVDYINVHGTSTPLGDVSEVKAIQKVFGNHAYNLNISSTKSMTGHLLGAAGVVEAIACIMAVKNNIIPPTINHENHDPEIDEKLNLTLKKAQKRRVNYALSNTFGFGGHNASVLFKKHS